MDRVKRIWYLSPMPIRAVSPEPPLLAHTGSESRGTFRQKARSLAPLNGWACAVKICHDGMLEDTNSLDGAHIISAFYGFLVFVNHPMETVLRVPDRGLTDIMCNFGSSVSAMSGFSLFTQYVLLIFSLKCSDMAV